MEATTDIKSFAGRLIAAADRRRAENEAHNRKERAKYREEASESFANRVERTLGIDAVKLGVFFEEHPIDGYDRPFVMLDALDLVSVKLIPAEHGAIAAERTLPDGRRVVSYDINSRADLGDFIRDDDPKFWRESLQPALPWDKKPTPSIEKQIDLHKKSGAFSDDCGLTTREYAAIEFAKAFLFDRSIHDRQASSEIDRAISRALYAADRFVEEYVRSEGSE